VIGGNENSQLPKGWIWTTVGEISEKIQYGYTASAVSETVGPRLLRITDIQCDNVDWNKVPYCKIGALEKQKYLLSEGDLVFARTGATVGKSFLIKGKIPEAVFASYLIRIILSKYVRKEFVSNFFKSGMYWQQIQKGQLGIGQPNVNSQTLSKVEIPLAPFNEQERIIGKFEELFARLDAGVEGLRKIKTQLKRYCQAVLKYAFEGKLTEEWRKTHRDQIEPATKILEQISQENAVESNLPELPEGWIWTRLELITTNHDGKRVPVSMKKRESMKGVYPYYGASGIIDSVDDYLFDGNFLLIGEDGANLLARATPIAYQATGKFWVNNHAHVLTSLGGVPISYLEHYINRISLAEYVTGTAQPKLTQRAMNKIPVPLAPLKEQYKIAEEINRRFSVIDEISKEMELMIRYSDRLRQSILKTAFEGKLVPQDPGDEPAENLLDRIKAERAKSKGEKDTNRKNRSQLELSGYVE
jgi:type I restriction enzyme S subunit